jgi:hypothetical protein
MSNLENQLRKLRPRSVPPDLRREVLKACIQSEEVSGFRFQVSAFLRAIYPGHSLTAALGCLWLVILAFHLDTPESRAPSGPPISWAAWKEAKQERDLLLAQMETPRFEVDLNKGSFSIPREDLKPN